MKKFQLPSLSVLVRGMNRSPHSAKRRLGWSELSATVPMLMKQVGPLHRMQSKVNVAILNYPLRHWQPMEDVAKNQYDVLIFTKTDNKTIDGMGTICRQGMTTADVPQSKRQKGKLRNSPVFNIILRNHHKRFLKIRFSCICFAEQALQQSTTVSDKCTQRVSARASVVKERQSW